MAEHNEQERTEQPTQKRIDDARRRGQIPRSRELNMVAVMLAGAGALMGSGQYMASGLMRQMQSAFDVRPDRLMAPDFMQIALSEATVSALTHVMPVLLATLAAALVAPLLIGGWNLSFQALAPDWSRLSPVSGFKRIFGVHGWIELAKALIKCVVIGGIGLAVTMWLIHDTMALGNMDPVRGIGGAVRVVSLALIVMSASLAIIALVDVPFQLWHYNKQLRMTRQEIRDEMKETDGRPETKSRIRQLQQQLARRRMMQQVPTADVIITNPTHYAVALKYRPDKMRAPRVVAKGVDLIALAIRKLGEENRVPVFESPLLARALYRSTNINKDIPGGLYVAVAQILTYLYRLKTIPPHLAPQMLARLKRPETATLDSTIGPEFRDA